MGLLGGIIGGVIGSMFGPVGGVIGAGLGLMLSADNKSKNPKSEQPDQTHLIFLFKSFGKLAKSDGVVSQSEADIVQNVLRSLELPKNLRTPLIKAFSDGRNSSESFSLLVRKVAALYEKKFYPDIMKLYCIIAMADGIPTEIESAELADAEKIFRLKGFCREFFKESETENEHASEPEGLSLDEAYKILGVTPDISDQALRQVWRKKVLEFHPDKIQGKGLPDAFIKFAEEETMRINSAYETICKKRNIK